MPRLAPSLLRRAASRNRHLPQLLQECRDLASAMNELRWLTGHAFVDDQDDVRRIRVADHNHHHHYTTNRLTPDERLMRFVHRRAKGEPLQYILGSQPFGDLEILCRPGVLIPRPETEVYTTTLAGILEKLPGEAVVREDTPLTIVDLCTGTGCIALLLHALLCPPHFSSIERRAVRILGADVSPHALRLAQKNLEHNLKLQLLHSTAEDDINFCHMDVLRLGHTLKQGCDLSSSTIAALPDTVKYLLDRTWDVIVSNPPYISPSDYAPGGTVGRSVRGYEPKLALVPPSPPSASFFTLSSDNAATLSSEDQADQFYAALLRIARKVEAKVLVMEIGDAAQAARVRRLASEIMAEKVIIETWTDDGHLRRGELSTQDGLADAAPDRAIVVWQGPWAEWRRESGRGEEMQYSTPQPDTIT